MNKTDIWTVLLLLSCCLVLQTGCKKKAADHPAEASAEPFQITVSQGGGFTGIYQGFTLHSDGKIDQWQKNRAGELKILKSIQVEAKEIVPFSTELEQDDLLKMKLTQTGNMTTKIVYQNGDSTFVWTWQSGGKISPQMQKWYDSITTFCKQNIQ